MSKKHYIIPIFIPHQGCPHDCIFCNQRKITGQSGNISIEEAEEIVEKHLKTIDSMNATVEIAFFGGSFTGIPWDDQNKFLALANKYLKDGKIDTIRLSTRPDYISKDIVNNLKKYGASIVELGIQSMDKDVLGIARRGHSPEDVINAISLLKDEGFIVGAQLMVGLPGDDENKAMETAKKISELKPHIARIYPVLVIKDTYLEEMYSAGLYKPLSIDDAVHISKNMLIELEKSGIRVIRVGLQPTDDLRIGDSVVAGPYHPSMRQLVESEIFKSMIIYILETVELSKFNTIKVLSNPRDFSSVLGQKRSNYEFIKKLYTDQSIIFKEDTSLDVGSIAVVCGEKSIKLSKNTYYHKISF
ncbi:elongator complex protein 3 [Lutispora thermophila]|uniref:Radical SAM superfamily protein n=1 Tax=Lutispora thermophila DSM 19022 TaxID=1122184 RepID=A0A1M6G514_9FIRM|nr:radical SAM protein [Lutispora thermophila]SHJ05012.1 Radical SAM superfamily protein [Lutispora thermophila DSM 19022]